MEILHPVTHEIPCYHANQAVCILNATLLTLHSYQDMNAMYRLALYRLHKISLYRKANIFNAVLKLNSEWVFHSKMILERSQSYKSASPILRKLNIGHRFFHFSFKFHFLNAKSLRGRVNAYWTCAHFFLSGKPLSISLKAHMSSLMTHLGKYIIKAQNQSNFIFLVLESQNISLWG